MRPFPLVATVLACIAILAALAALSDGIPPSATSSADRIAPDPPSDPVPVRFERATFGAGCFWCSEAVFARLKGVASVQSGYSGGRAQNPTHKQVRSGETGHAEVVQVTFDPDLISFAELLEVFWRTHDPTTRDRQGSDYGPQYRSAVFYRSEEQRKLAVHHRERLTLLDVFDDPIVTEIAPFKGFYAAEEEHRNFYRDNPNLAYCRAVIAPKIKKLEEAFGDMLNDEG